MKNMNILIKAVIKEKRTLKEGEEVWRRVSFTLFLMSDNTSNFTVFIGNETGNVSFKTIKFNRKKIHELINNQK